MCRIRSLNTNSQIPDNSLQKTPAKNTETIKTIEIPDYDDSQTKEQDIDSFKKDVSSKLGVKAEEVQIINSKFGIKAKVNGSFDEVNIKFKDNLDLSRIAKYSASSSTAVLVNFGDDKNERVIKIANYTNSLTKEAQIQLFKDDIAREMKTEIKNIEVFVVDDKIVARKRNSAENTIVEFSDPVDGQKFMDYAKETVSKRLKDFGIKRQEGIVTVGGSTNTLDPKAGTNLTQSVSYSAFLDKQGTHRVSINSETNFGINGQFSKENIKNFSIAYQNLDLPFVGDFGEVKLSYGNGKFGVDGKSDAIELQADRISKKFINDLKQGDGKAIAITAGALAGVGAGLIIAKNTLSETKDIDIPVKTNVYNNGTNTVKAIVAPTVHVGGGKLGVSVHKVGAEVKQNIASGINFREQTVYDFKDKQFNTEIEANYNRAYLRISNKYSMSNSDNSRTYISLGHSQTLTQKMNLSYGYSQEFNKDFKSANQNLNIGMDYSPNEKWRINAGTGLTKPNFDTKIGVTFGASVSYRF